METVLQQSTRMDVKPLCEALEFSRATFYRRRSALQNPSVREPRPRPPLALSVQERQSVLDVLHCEQYVDKSPQVVYAELLDKGDYLCAPRTMYRILASENEIRERRNQRRHYQYEKPELLATCPNQVWSWDITKLKGPVKWTYYYLYVILDIFSRYVVGWMVAHRESAELAKRLIRESCVKQNILPDQLTLHADRGSSMKSKAVALLLSDLGLTKTHSRPYVSNDNPFSEAQFKTLKYRPNFPKRFGCIQDAQSHCQGFFKWYNTEHLNSGIAMLTAETVHHGHAEIVLKQRAAALKAAYRKHPKRFKGKQPVPAELPEAVWINKPKITVEKTKEATKSA
jgi:putative transposase